MFSITVLLVKLVSTEASASINQAYFWHNQWFQVPATARLSESEFIWSKDEVPKSWNEQGSTAEINAPLIVRLAFNSNADVLIETNSELPGKLIVRSDSWSQVLFESNSSKAAVVRPQASSTDREQFAIQVYYEGPASSIRIRQ